MGLQILIGWASTDSIAHELHNIAEGIAVMSQQLDDLKREVQESRQVTEGAITMIGGLADQIRELKEDPEALEELAAELDAQQTALAAAITANTPVEQPTPPAEPTEPQ